MISNQSLQSISKEGVQDTADEGVSRPSKKEVTIPDVSFATAYLATKAQHSTKSNHKSALRIISYRKETSYHCIN